MEEVFLKIEHSLFINHFVVMAMDAKLNFDDNASFRQKEVFALRDKSQEDKREVCKLIDCCCSVISVPSPNNKPAPKL